MAFEQTWRWFGLKDPITLKEIKQTGATGVVTALHHIPTGEVWSTEEILKRKQIIEDEGLTWSVVESVTVHENIKKQAGNYKQLIDNYKKTIRNLGQSGIDILCYNFMPLLDWLRTDLNVIFGDGSITTKFEAKALAVFDLFILKRPGAELSYNEDQIEKAIEYFKRLNEDQKNKLTETILLGLPGSLEAYTLDEFKSTLNEYKHIGDSELRDHLYNFIKEIVPVAEESKVYLAIHADDPPRPVLGLPRVVSNKNDIEQLLNAVDSLHNGLTFCTGSLGANINNDVVDMAKNFAYRINFLHLRNVERNVYGDFLEDNTLDGDIDLYNIMKIMLLEQKRRQDQGINNNRMPLRPDHGHLMIPDQHKKGIYPGYSLFGRMRNISELRGLELGIRRSLCLE